MGFGEFALRTRQCVDTASASTPEFHRGRRSSHLMTGVHEMSDLLFVILTGAFFALLSLIVKGVERL
jgi:hypothetical protein